MWDIWVGPMAAVIILMLAICAAGIKRFKRSAQLHEDDYIPEAAAEHPFALNPLLWIIAVASFFTFIVIFYYWASFY